MTMLSKFDAPSASELSRRRQYLRAKRRYSFYKTVWRSLAITAIATGTLWLATSPVWLLKSGEQLEVSGNQLLSDKNVQALVPLNYPQSLLKVKPDDLADSLETYQPIERAMVSRRLIPPGLHVRIHERVPVAVALPDITTPVKAIPDQPVPFKEPGLIDAEGYWMPRNSFRDIGASASPPSLMVVGMRKGYESSWQAMFEVLARSSVKVTSVDWTHTSNLILQSELGEVHLGPYGKGFEAQMAALDQMRSLPSEVNPEKVAFIDLHDPANPVIEILQAASQ
ncbi:MAG: FtsQ-type POTRA domain-containing protein [Phormidesmis sp.]